MIRFPTAILAAAACLALLGGCTKTATDDTLANNIKAGLYSDQTTKAANISVGVKGGVVTLTGDVPSSDVALEAMKVANGTAGVRSVNDQLTINGVSAANQTATPPPPGSTAPADSGTPATNTASNPYGPSTAPQSNPPPTNPTPSAYAPPVVPPHREEPAAVTVPAGERLSVRTIDPIDSNTNHTGQVFRASLNAPLMSRGRAVVPAGADATLELTAARDSGRIQGRPVLEVRLVGLRFHGERYRVDSSAFQQQ